MNIIKKISSIIVVSCILMGLVSCSNVDTSWIAEYNGEKMAVGVYIQCLIEEYSQLYIKDLMGKMTNPEKKSDKKSKIGDSKEEALDKEKNVSILKKIIDGKTGTDWIIDNAKEKIGENIAIDNKFKEMNLKLDEEKVDYIEHNLIKEWDALNEQQQYEKKGISRDSVLKTLITHMKKQKIFDAYYSEGGLKEVTNEQIKKYLKENYNKVKYFSFELYGLNDDEKSKKEKLYDEFLKRAESGEDIDLLIEEFDKKEYASNDDSGKTEDTQKSNDESGYDHTTDEEDETVAIYKKDGSGEFTKDIQEAIDKADMNKVEGYKGKDELIIFIKKDPADSKEYIEKNKNDLISEMKSKEFEEEVKTWVDVSKIKYNEDAINKYTPKKLGLDKKNNKK